MNGLAVLLEELYFQSSHLEVVAGVCLVRLDNIPQLAEANRSGQFFESGFFEAQFEGQSSA